MAAKINPGYKSSMAPETLQLLALPTVIILLVYSGWKRQPGIGILLGLIIIAYSIWSHPDGLAWVGFRDQASWPGTIGWAFLLALIIALFSTALLEPYVERMTGRAHDVSIVEGVRGSWRSLVQWLVVVWIFVALLEELIFRGYMMTALPEMLGRSTIALTVNLLLSSAVFGLAHAYQGPSGVVSTGTIGVLIGLIFLISAFNLWLVILVHGFIDTIQLTFISADVDRRLRTLLIKPGQPD